MTALHVFDMDGTLLRGGTASQRIAAVHGTADELLVLETRFAAGEMDTRRFATEIHALWSGLSAAVVEAAFAGSTWMNGIAEVCADIHERGERSAVITMSPDFFAEHLRGYGFDAVVASRFPALPLAEPVALDAVLTPSHKVQVVDGLLQQYGIGRSRCVAYGDSMSDAPLFRHLAATVAVNADRHLAGLATAEYRGDDLTEAYRLGRTQLS